MAESNLENYLRWVTPTPGDPSYSLLKAHLLIEDLVRAHLARRLAHPKALEGARLTFVQLLAVARAVSSDIAPDHWIWQAMAELNRLRNMLSHEVQPKSLAKRMNDYANFVRHHNKVPFPEAVEATRPAGSASGPRFTSADLASLGLYIKAAAMFGFDVEAFIATESNRTAEVGSELEATTPNGASGSGKAAE